MTNCFKNDILNNGSGVASVHPAKTDGRIAQVLYYRIENMYYVYVIWNGEAQKYYIGQTNDLEKRISQHNDPYNTYSKYTKRYQGLWKLIYYEKYATRKEAKKREKYIKNSRGREFIKNKILSSLTTT